MWRDLRQIVCEVLYYVNVCVIIFVVNITCKNKTVKILILLESSV